ncbi:MAG TPA: hypothetical protein PKA27_05370 [Fimbriimonadaceae bacterium]|nr:hypothetical protein [Fimbriimonadaceae bacterium]
MFALLLGLTIATGSEARDVYIIATKKGSVSAETLARYGKVVSRKHDLYTVEVTSAKAERLRMLEGVTSIRREDEEPNRSSVKALKRYVDARYAEAKAAREKKPTGIGSEDGYLWYMQMRAFPKDTIDWSKYPQAAKHREQMLRPAASATDASSWFYCGPAGLDVPYRQYWGLSPVNGRITAAVGHPDDLDTFYVGGPMGGVWKYSNAAWTWLSKDWDILPVASLDINRINPDFIYAGTGDFDAGLDYGHGIMYTSDGGTTWTESGASQFGTFPVSHVVVDPESPNVVMATTASRNFSNGGDVWRSTTGGINIAGWTTPIGVDAAWFDVKYGAWDQGLGARRYYAIGSNSTTNYLYMSTDRGATWAPRNLPNGLARDRRMKIATSKLFPQTIYLLATSAERIFKSTNAGNTWSDITNNFPNGRPGDPDYNWSQFHDSDIETSGVEEDIVYVGLIDAARSTNGGQTWSSIGGPTFNSAGALTHNDQRVIANTADPNYMLFGNDGGAYLYTKAGGVQDTWLNFNDKLGVTQFYHSAHHPTNEDIMLGGTQDNATPRSGGNLANWDNVAGGDGAGCAINQDIPDRQYANAQRYSLDSGTGLCNIFTTLDSWNSSGSGSFNPGGDTLPFIGAFELDPSDQTMGYFGTNFLWRFVHIPGFMSFFPRLGGTSLATGGGTITSISISPSNRNVIYTGSSSGDVFVTTDGGSNWRDITGALPSAAVTDLEVHPTDPNDIVVVLSGTGTGHVYQCDNTSVNNPVWANKSGSGLLGLPDISANTIIRSGYDPENTWWVGNDVGVFLTASKGASWLNINALGLPNVQVNDLTFVPGNSHVFAATFGRGMWRIEIFPPNTTISEASGPASRTAGQPLPITVVLDHPAPDSGTRVNLSSSSPSVVVPPTAYVPFNEIETTVQATTRRASLTTMTATITAQLLNSTKVINVTINPPSGLFGVELGTVVKGELFSGGVPDLATADGVSVEVFNDPTTLQARLEMRGESPIASPTGLAAFWFSGVARPGLAENLFMLDVTTLQWVSISGRVATTSIAYNSATNLSTPTRFVGPNQKVRAALEWAPINDEDPAQDGWLHSLDFFAWQAQ